ncbi:MAG: Fic family protein [Myxococcota bacterium]|nr:Fic family protein [Myxococcota bacterium]
MARGIRGSNSIEGFDVSEDDAAAAVEGDAPYDTTAEAPSWLAVIGYRDAMTHALRQGSDPDATIDLTLLRSLHYMMLKHDPSKHPGSWRPGSIFVRDERIEKIVYEGPPREIVGKLMAELINQRKQPNESPLVTAAMAHLNLAMIHPFSDGNGRMARCFQTLILAKAGVFDPVFCSIEEWLGVRVNTDEYYDVLAKVGGGYWNPQNSAGLWIRFVLKAHFQQAATVERRQIEAGDLWTAIEERLKKAKFPDRAAPPLLEGAFGRSIRNSRYRLLAEVSPLTASRDLKALVEEGLLNPVGDGKGRYYKASQELLLIRDSVRKDKSTPDPFSIY